MSTSCGFQYRYISSYALAVYLFSGGEVGEAAESLLQMKFYIEPEL